MLPGVDLTPKLAIVPLLNVSLLCKELVTGNITGIILPHFCFDVYLCGGGVVSGGEDVSAGVGVVSVLMAVGDYRRLNCDLAQA